MYLYLTNYIDVFIVRFPKAYYRVDKTATHFLILCCKGSYSFLFYPVEQKSRNLPWSFSPYVPRSESVGEETLLHFIILLNLLPYRYIISWKWENKGSENRRERNISLYWIRKLSSRLLISSATRSLLVCVRNYINTAHATTFIPRLAPFPSLLVESEKCSS